MKRAVLGILLTLGLLVGLISAPASAENPPGYPDLIGFTYGSAVPPAATLPADIVGPMAAGERGTLFYADPAVRSDVGWYEGLIGSFVIVQVLVGREDPDDPSRTTGFQYQMIGLPSVSGSTVTLTGWARMGTFSTGPTGWTDGPWQPTLPAAVTLVEG